jgi:predicted ferric reductase
MGSDLNVISEVSKGSEFYFTLPASGDFMKRTKRKIQELEAELLSILVLGTVRKYDKQLVASLKNRAEICYSKSISDLCQKLRSTSQFPDIVLCYPDSDMDEASTLINVLILYAGGPILVITR